MPEIPLSHHFEHEAMNTTFHLRICGDDPKLAGGMARECFEELDVLEGQLSRFLVDSDVSRINAMAEGDSLFVSETTHQCLILALELHQQTGGLFDVTLGSAIEHQKSELPGTAPPITGSLAIEPDRPSISCHGPGRQIDLGGIGKGFALDQLKRRLIDWEAPGALLAAGASTQLAFGEAAWPITLQGDRERHSLSLLNQALSASGTGIQGAHIVHPDGPNELARLDWKRAWLTASSAAAADAWSTAAILMTGDQLGELGSIETEITSLFIESSTGIEAIIPPI